MYHVLMTLKNTIEPFYNNYTGKYVNVYYLFVIMFVYSNSGQASPGDSGIGSQGIFRYVEKWVEWMR